jgi:outer membrane receptor protein involved in Fe transport
MNKFIVISFFSILFLVSFYTSYAQGPPDGGPGGRTEGGPGGGGMRGGGNFQGNNQALGIGRISGTLTDSLQNPVQYASAAIYESESFEPVTGVITDEEGIFNLKNIPAGNYALEISYVGFRKIRINNITISLQNKEIMLGDIILKPSREMMEGITVTAEAQTVDYKIDRKVISVSQDIVARGGSVVEALENVPSVKTDINGDVTVRGSSNFTVLVDGKPSVLTGSEALQQIPANAVENIEIITNPSARYDPDGDAGIINVIMKKKFADGISAIINGSAGTPQQYGVDFSTVYRTEKGTVTMGFDYRNRDMDIDGNMYRETYLQDTTETQTSTTSGNRGRGNMNFKLGYDMNVGEMGTLSLQGTIGKRKNNAFTQTNSVFGYIPTSEEYYETSENTSKDEGLQFNALATYIRNFDLNGHKLETGLQIMGSNNEGITDLTEYKSDNDWDLIYPVYTQSNIENNDNIRIRFNADYTKPFKDGGKLEAGYLARIEDSDSHFELNTIDEEGLNIETDSTLNDLNIFRNIQAVYGVYSNTIGYLGYQVGLRTEYTGRDVNQITTDQKYEIDRIDLFPSLHLSYKFASGDQFQASYSRRVNRPRDRQLNPFPQYMDSRNIRMGNPFLEPEFIDSYELNYMHPFFMSFISAEAFFRKTNNVMTMVQDITDNGTIVSTYDNLNNDESYGVEAMASLQLFEWWRFTLSTSIYRYTISGETSGEYVDNSSLSWNGRLMSMFTLPWNMRIQLNGIYNSEKASAQGSRQGFMMTNLAVRKDFLDSKLGLTFQVRDIFQQMNFAAASRTEYFYTENEFSPVSPMFSINISLKLNNYKRNKGTYGSNTDMIEMDYMTDFAY